MQADGFGHRGAEKGAQQIGGDVLVALCALAPLPRDQAPADVVQQRRRGQRIAHALRHRQFGALQHVGTNGDPLAIIPAHGFAFKQLLQRGQLGHGASAWGTATGVAGAGSRRWK